MMMLTDKRRRTRHNQLSCENFTKYWSGESSKICIFPLAWGMQSTCEMDFDVRTAVEAINVFVYVSLMSACLASFLAASVHTILVIRKFEKNYGTINLNSIFKSFVVNTYIGVLGDL
jgi:hypothetical protein